MKKILALVLLLPLLLALASALSIGVAMQSGMVSQSELQFLLNLGKRAGPGAVFSVIRTHLYGVDPADAGDPSYGRQLVTGRGHAPWVIRGNLDGRPRILKFALAPGIWAAYDTEQLSLYQVWQGDVQFAGAAYDHRHGPQPASEGAWYQRDTKGATWFIEVDGREIPATVNYLGHEYRSEMQTAAMRFTLTAADYELDLKEQPELLERNGERYFTRHFERVDQKPALQAGFYTGTGDRHLAQGTLELPLQTATDINNPAAAQTSGDETTAEQGKAVIANSDCLGCHAQTHRVSGPAWSQIAGKFHGSLRPEIVTSLTHSVMAGSNGKWGKIPMPAHPALSEAQARAAVTYILSVTEVDTQINPPLDETGLPFSASRDYDIVPELRSLHPSFALENLAPKGFEPKVGGMAFRDDGKLVLASWDQDGAVFLIDTNAPMEQRVQRIAEGLHEPLGLTIVNGSLFVLQKQELTELIDTDGDDIIDVYRAVTYDWPSSSNFHSFAFGLLHRHDAFYFLLSICVLPGGASCPDQLPTQGKLLRADMDGKVEVVASGFRTPNGIGIGPADGIYVADNQGDWLPASKIVHIQEGEFYGSRAVPDEDVITLPETPPVVWLPQDEVGNSPTQPFLLIEGPYAGQMLHGDVYNGGVKRVFLESVAGRQQGAVFHFSAGFQGGVNRLERGPDGAIYVGEIGNPPNWGEYNKSWFGLERLTYLDNNAFEMLSVQALDDGFLLEFTQPLAPDLTVSAADLQAKQWFYHPNEQYGGPKYDETVLPVSHLEVTDDRRSLRAHIPGLRAGHVVYLRLDDRLRSAAGTKLWTREAWYTLNAIPDKPQATPSLQAKNGWHDLFNGKNLDGWRNYGGNEDEVEKWAVQNGTLALTQEGPFPMWDLISSVIFGGGSGDLIYYRESFKDFELSLEWKISKNGNSGIFYLVADETENTPWLTGIEMQVLDNEGHDDGRIETHRAGDLYDLIAATPETVRPPGQWNKVTIRVKDNLIEHWLNGAKVVSITRGSPEWEALLGASKFADMPRVGKAERGYIVLQDHGDRVWYRNIRVRTL